MNYQSLIASIQAAIYNNGTELITGNVLQGVLLDMVNALDSAGATYGGTITPASAAPADLDQPTVYLAMSAGTYTNFRDSNNNPIVITCPSLIVYDGGDTLTFTAISLPFPQVLSVYGGDSLCIAIPAIMHSYRIDMTAVYNSGEAGTETRWIGSLVIECENLYNYKARGYYYGDEMDSILQEVAIWKDDPDGQNYYLILTANSDLDSLIFSISSLDGKDVQVIDEPDDIVKVADATITPVGGGSSDVFVAEYGVTTYQQVADAIAEGKAVIAKNGTSYFVYSRLLNGTYMFYNTIASNITIVSLRSNNAWSTSVHNNELSNNKVSIISGNETNTTKYPNTKAVADALGKMGVISQTQTWSGSGSNPRTYVMSNPVTGLIPQANIDLFESAGATFNSTSGYFELNGLTDISYEEMQKIYNQSRQASARRWGRLFNYATCRTNLPFYWYGVVITNQMDSSDFSNGLTGSTLESFLMPPKKGSDVMNVSSVSALLYNANYIKEIINPFKITGNVIANTFGAPSLESLQLHGITFSANFDKCSNLSLSSVVYMVENAANTSAITITLHATAYARCQADTTEYTYQGNTYTGIIALATAKNITIASA